MVIECREGVRIWRCRYRKPFHPDDFAMFSRPPIGRRTHRHDSRRGMPVLTTQNRRYWSAGAIRLAAALLWLSGGAAVGQPTPAGTEQDEQAIALFKELLKDPTNVDLNFRYAEAAVKQGNYEGAISALERLLLYNPNFPGAKLQLAELYARLGSYNAARAYLGQVESAQDVTPATRARARASRRDGARDLTVQIRRQRACGPASPEQYQRRASRRRHRRGRHPADAEFRHSP